MQTKLKLPTSFVDKLSALPEQGMGYQIVNVFLRSGVVLKKRKVLNSTYLLLESNETIIITDIENVVIDKT